MRRNYSRRGLATVEARLHGFIYLEEASVLDEGIIGPLRVRNTLTLIPGILALHSWLVTRSPVMLIVGSALLALTLASALYPRRTMRLEQLLLAYLHIAILVAFSEEHAGRRGRTGIQGSR